jgi:hypothetical protein
VLSLHNIVGNAQLLKEMVGGAEMGGEGVWVTPGTGEFGQEEMRSGNFVACPQGGKRLEGISEIMGCDGIITAGLGNFPQGALGEPHPVRIGDLVADFEPLTGHEPGVLELVVCE